MQLDPANVAQGKRCAEVRKHYGLTQNEFGKGIGLSGKQISKIERGQSKVSVPLLRRTAKYLGCSTTTLLNPQGSPLPERNKRRRRKTDPPNEAKPEPFIFRRDAGRADGGAGPVISVGLDLSSISLSILTGLNPMALAKPQELDNIDPALAALEPRHEGLVLPEPAREFGLAACRPAHELRSIALIIYWWRLLRMVCTPAMVKPDIEIS